VLYFRDRNEPAEPARATAVPGHYQLIDVLDAINDKGVSAQIGGPTTGVRSRMLGYPGQLITIGDGSVYVFVYPDIASQEDSTLDVDAADIDIKTASGDPIDSTDATLSAKSNIAVLIINADEKTVAKIEDAIQSLP
jgi:hypothetical protein